MSEGYLQIMRVPSKEIGYGRMGVYLDEEIRKLGYQVSNSLDDAPASTVLHCSTPSHLLRYVDGQRLVVLTMFESTEVPEAFRESLHLFDTVIVPSEQNRALFSQYHDNVHMVPLGIDPAVWKPTKRPADPHRFTFLTAGSGPRKGPDLAYRAFRMAFPEGSWDGPEPWLVLKSPRPSPFAGERVVQINGRLTDVDEVALYASANCYLGPSRGEGFGLQPLQAIAQGCPTILTNAHGHASFAHLGIPISATVTPTVPGSFMYGEAGDWWEPDVAQIAQWMRLVYDNYDDACEDAWASALTVAKEWTWEQTARKVMAIIGDLPDYAGSGQMRTPEVKLFRIVLVKHHGAEIAGASYSWEPFTEYWVTADVKRVLFDAGLLDPSCVFGDSGLLKEVVEASGLKSGAESYCGTCHQRLGSQPSRADWIFAEMNEAIR